MDRPAVATHTPTPGNGAFATLALGGPPTVPIGRITRMKGPRPASIPPRNHRQIRSLIRMPPPAYTADRTAVACAILRLDQPARHSISLLSLSRPSFRPPPNLSLLDDLADPTQDPVQACTKQINPSRRALCSPVLVSFSFLSVPEAFFLGHDCGCCRLILSSPPCSTVIGTAPLC